MNSSPNFWFATKEEVVELYVQSNYEDGFLCVCSSKTYECGRANSISCVECSRTTSLTAGTFFHGYRIEIEKLALILFHYWLNPNVAAFALSRELQLAFTTVWRILHKLRRKVRELFPADKYEQIDCRFFAQVCFKRSGESPAKADPVQASQTTEKIESNRLLQQLTPPLCQLLESAHSRLRTGFQGISRKHLQPYLLAVFFEPIRRTKEEFEAFFRSVLRSRPIMDIEIECYSSPELLSLPCPI
jgi:hypothetical protein